MELLIIIIAIIIVAIFTFSITYINHLNRNKLKHESKYIQKILKNPGRYIIRAELAITTLEFLISGIAVETYAKTILMNLSSNTGISVFLLKYIVIVVIITISAYVTTIFGKYIPKHLAIQYFTKNNHFILLFFSVISVILLPFTIVANIFDEITKNIFKVKKKENADYLTNKVIEFTNIEYEKGTIKKYEKDLIDKTIKLDEVRIYDVYKKIDNVISIEINSSLDDILATFKKHEYSRIPVYENIKTNIVGTIYIKDILYNLKELENNTIKITDIIRVPLYENNNILLSTIFRKMKKDKIHIVVVKDKKLVVGILTFEDVIEKILGKITDEFKN